MPVLAARSGVVVWVTKDSRIGGSSKKYWNDGNRIVIKHENGEYTAYEHMKYAGVLVKVGRKVRAGQVIGYSGSTGYISFFGPHLHFEVFVDPDKWEAQGHTIKVHFKELGNMKVFRGKRKDI